jgi:predicted transcriptional regulator of viral defense system
MGSNGITDGVERFVRAHIHSVEQLEVLLHLRAQAARAFTADELARELRIHAASAQDRLEDLKGRGLLASPEGGAYRYQPPPALAGDVDALARTYAERRVSVINLIFSKPSEGISTFADAFKLFGKKGKP